MLHLRSHVDNQQHLAGVLLEFHVPAVNVLQAFTIISARMLDKCFGTRELHWKLITRTLTL